MDKKEIKTAEEILYKHWAKWAKAVFKDFEPTPENFGENFEHSFAIAAMHEFKNQGDESKGEETETDSSEWTKKIYGSDPDEFQSRYNNLVKGEETKWISVEDRLPVKGQKVIVIQSPLTTATKEPIFAIFNGKDFIPPSHTIFADFEVAQSKWVDIIFWMPLPKPPKT